MGLDINDLENMIDDLQASEHQQSNCMLQLALMVARLALSSTCEEYNDHASQTMLELVRAKRRDSPVVTHSRFDPEQRKPWIVDVHTPPMPQTASASTVSARFRSGGLD